ncbi:MAG: hypothetical protein HOE45_04935 [Gammaproteobacteria bacterium]|mgnify:CR=1 FL=1|jgi:hypothetical protein|nr:hypothetical protein [Gammaproteobacteria bacterium]
MDKLFIDPIEFEKQGMSIYLDKDSGKWVKEIVTHFLTEYPSLQNEAISVEWKRKDAAKGYGVGSLKVAGANIPIIAKQWEVSPLDVIMVGDETYPLTHDVLNNLMSSPDPYKGVSNSTPKGSTALFDGKGLQHSPTNTASEGYSNRYEYRKVASVIDTLQDVDVKDVNTIIDTINKNTAIKLAFKSNGTFDVVEKLSNKNTTTAISESENWAKDLPIDRQYSFKDSLGNWVVKQANSSVDYVWETPVSASEASTYVTKCAASEDNTGEDASLVGNGYELMDGSGHIYLTPELSWHKFDAGVIKSASNFKVKNAVPEVGNKGMWVVDGKVSEPFEVLSIEKTAQTYPGNTYKIASGGTLHVDKEYNWHLLSKETVKTAEVFDTKECAPEVGDFGVWNIDGSVTRPFEVIGMQKVAGPGNWRIDAYSGLSKVAYYPIRKHNEELIKHESQKDSMYVPGNAQFIKLNAKMSESRLERFIEQDVHAHSNGALQISGWDGQRKVAYYPTTTIKGPELVEHDMFKNAYYVPESATFVKLSKSLSVIFDALPTEVTSNYVGKDNIGLYYLEGKDFSKYAETHNTRELSYDDVMWSLIHCNATETDIDKVAKLQSNAKTALGSIPISPLTSDEVSTAIQTAYDASNETIKMLQVDLIKEAAVLADKGTVDSILSLGLLKKSNVKEFISLVPHYESVMSDMAKLLLTTRIGLSSVPEEAVKTAMVSISQIVTVLKQLGQVYKGKN